MVLKEITIGLNGIRFINTIVVVVKDMLSEKVVDILKRLVIHLNKIYLKKVLDMYCFSVYI